MQHVHRLKEVSKRELQLERCAKANDSGIVTGSQQNTRRSPMVDMAAVAGSPCNSVARTYIQTPRLRREQYQVPPVPQQPYNAVTQRQQPYRNREGRWIDPQGQCNPDEYKCYNPDY